MKTTSSFFALLVLIISFLSCHHPDDKQQKDPPDSPIHFVTHIQQFFEIPACLNLCNSIRERAGSFDSMPISVYYYDYLNYYIESYKDEFAKLNIRLVKLTAPGLTFQYFFGGKPYLAARVEEDLENHTGLIVFLDPNVLILKEPKAFALSDSISFAYRPVFHQNVGSLYEEAPDEYWGRIYEILEVPDSLLFPMKTVGDKKIIRPYINAGLHVVRPEAKLFRTWAEYFGKLADDKEIKKLCHDHQRNIFLHQAAFTCAILNTFSPEQMKLLPANYNYPLFFDLFFDSEIKFDSIDGLVTLKCDFNPHKLPDNWPTLLKGDSLDIAWLKSKIANKYPSFKRKKSRWKTDSL